MTVQRQTRSEEITNVLTHSVGMTLGLTAIIVLMIVFYWLVAGGLFYSIGTIFFFLDTYRYMHSVWHLFVLGGSVCHFISIYKLA